MTKVNYAVTNQSKWTVALMVLAAAVVMSPARAQSFADEPTPVDSALPAPSAVISPVVPSTSATPIASRVFATPREVAPKVSSHAKTWWVLSGVAMTAASMVDLGTSMGHNEANPALRNSTGQFSVGRGVSIKLGVSGITLLVQSLLTRRHPEMYGPSTVINLVGAGIFGGVAYHNANTPR